MTHLSITEAERRCDVSRPTLSKTLKTAKRSGRGNAKRRWESNIMILSQVGQTRDVLPDKEPDNFATRVVKWLCLISGQHRNIGRI